MKNDREERSLMSILGIVIAFFAGRYFVQSGSTENFVEWLYMQIPVLRIIAFVGVILLLAVGWYEIRQSKVDADADTRVAAIKHFLYAFILAVIGLISCFV